VEHPWLSSSTLWLVLDRCAAAPRSLPEVTELAIAGGVDAVLCRLKDAPPEEVYALSREVREVCGQHDTPFVMSHYPQLALDLGADAVQIGVQDPPIAEVRQVIGDRLALGYSTHGVGEARRCFAAGADYVFLGPIFATPEKLKYGPPLGLETVAAAAELPGPVVFIGGISTANCLDVLRAGGRRIAAISALQRTDDPRGQARKLKQLLSSAEHDAG